MRNLLLFFLVLITEIAWASGGPNTHSPHVIVDPPPWFTGPLLSPSGHVVPKGYINVEPYLFYTLTTGRYTDHWGAESVPTFTNVNFQLPIWVGITEWMDIQVTPSASWNETQGVSNLVLDDFALELNFQVLEDTELNTLPGIKVYIEELFPLGRYQKLNPEYFETDSGGEGSYQTTLGFVITRTFHIRGHHYFAARFNGFYTLPTNVQVRGFNSFGGAKETKGEVELGDGLVGLLGMEYSLTQNWALACDVQALFNFKRKYIGRGPDLGLPPQFQLSIAPAIEYNFSQEFGIIGGGWFTLAGRNTPKFYSAVLAINYYGPDSKSTRHAFRTHGGGGGGR